MRNAEIAQEGTPTDLYQRPNSAFIADFIGDANLIDCDIVSGNGATSDIVVSGKTLTVANNGVQSGQAKLVLRPHQIALSPHRSAQGFDGIITYAAYLGNQIQYTLDGELGPLFAISRTTANPMAVGDNVVIGFDKTEVSLVPG